MFGPETSPGVAVPVPPFAIPMDPVSPSVSVSPVPWPATHVETFAVIGEVATTVAIALPVANAQPLRAVTTCAMSE